MNQGRPLKLYIAVLDSVPNHMVPVLVAHSILSAHLKFEENFIYRKWLGYSFKKCVISVNRKEFEKIKQLESHLGYESTILNGEPCCAIIMPQYDIPNVLKFAKLWKPKNEIE